MTNDIESSEPRRLALRGLPWLLALGALALYLLTLNRWMSVLNVGSAARVAGWIWQPELSHPVYFLLTLPLTFLPESWAALAVNLFSAVCAALTIQQLARTVALVPHDRTHDQREREASDGNVFSGALSWLPPVLAVCLCGLQITFWEHATNGSPEMLDLLLFAFVVRGLMEYRYQGRERWLLRSAFVMGVAMTSNAAMVAFFPVFLMALIWQRGLGFFNPRFLLRMTLYGFVGLSFYLLLPLVTSLKSPELLSFWDSLTQMIAVQKQMILPAKDQISMALPMRTIVLLAMPTLLPIFIISIRWASYFGDTSLTGQAAATIVFHLVHMFFLGLAFWLALDPPFGPRTKGAPYSFLPFYYLGAVGAGYFSGYFLLVFGPRVERRMRRPPTPVMDQLHKVSVAVVLVIFAVTPVALVLRNWDEIRTTNGPMLKEYASSLVANLPKRGMLISDDPFRQCLVQAQLADEGRLGDYIVLNSDWLKWDYYHRELHRRYGSGWPAPAKVVGKPNIQPSTLIAQIQAYSKSNQVCYLHPSFGYYFEVFQPIPRGFTFDLKQYGETQLLQEKLTPEILALNEKFFAGLAESLGKKVLPVTELNMDPNQFVGTGPFRKVRLRKYQNLTALVIGLHLSRAMNTWGVEQQKAGNADTARKWFELASRLNRDNVVAVRNLESNRKRSSGIPETLDIPRNPEDLFGSGRSWDQVLSNNGPFDDPSLRLLLGYLYLQTGLYRQSAQCFDRVRDFSETELTSRVWLAQLYLIARQPDEALDITKQIQASPEKFGLNATNRYDILTVETSAHFARNDPASAVALIEKEVAANERDDQVLGWAIGIYNQHGRYTNSLAVLERQLAARPDNLGALLNKGYMCIQIGEYDRGIAALNQLLKIETNNPSAILNRGIAFLKSERLDEARADYESLARQYPTTYQL